MANEEKTTVEQPEQPTPQTGMPKEVPEMTAGYMVGIAPDGKLIFEFLGKEEELGLIQILGLHKFAESKIDMARDVSQRIGFPVLATQIQQLGEMIRMLYGAVVTPPKQSIIMPP